MIENILHENAEIRGRWILPSEEPNPVEMLVQVSSDSATEPHLPRAIQGSFANCNISVDLDLFNGGIIEYI